MIVGFGGLEERWMGEVPLVQLELNNGFRTLPFGKTLSGAQPTYCIGQIFVVALLKSCMY